MLVLQPERIEQAEAELAALRADVMIVMAYGQLIKKRILALPQRAFINLHASLLPKYRGAACIQAAIANGDTHSGISSMHVVRKLDAGDVILSRSIPLTNQETGGSLHDKLADLAVDVMHETLAGLAAGTAQRTPQDEVLASHVPKLLREDGKIDWSRPAEEIERLIRAYDPWPGCYTSFEEKGAEKRLKLYPFLTLQSHRELKPGQLERRDDGVLVGTGTFPLTLGDVQMEGGKRMSAESFLLGRPLARFADL